MTLLEDRDQYDALIADATKENRAAAGSSQGHGSHCHSPWASRHHRRQLGHSQLGRQWQGDRFGHPGIVVIKFFASWCRACKAMAPKISRVAEDWPDIEFYEIMFDDNKKLCKSLGIKILPFVEIVAGTAGKVESFSCGPSKISQLQARARARREAAQTTSTTAPTHRAAAHRAPTNTAQAKLEVHGGCEMIPCTDVSAVLENL